MAFNITKAPCLRKIAVRSFGKPAESAGAPVGGFQNYEITTKKLPNKVIIASAENESVLSRVSVVFRAGSRYESPDEKGFSHAIRICAGLSTRRASQFAIIRNIQQAGCTLTCTNDREIIAYTLEGTRSAVEKSLPFLEEVATQQCFKPWEVSDNVPRLRLELASRSLQFRAVDFLHKAAYRAQGLGNSVFIAKFNCGRLSSESLQHYVKKNFTADRTAVVGLGIDSNYLLNFAQNLKLENCNNQADITSPYKGGEIRSEKIGDLAYVAIAGEGGCLTNAKTALSFAILQRCFGAGSAIKYGTESCGLLAKAGCNSGIPNSVKAFNVSYSDSGLFGALITAPAGDAGHMVKTVNKILRSSKVSEEDFKRGKNQLKTALLLALENGNTAVEDMAIQALFTGSVANAEEITNAIETIKISDVNDAAKSLAASKFSMAAVGNIKCVPFLDELK